MRLIIFLGVIYLCYRALKSWVLQAGSPRKTVFNRTAGEIDDDRIRARQQSSTRRPQTDLSVRQRLSGDGAVPRGVAAQGPEDQPGHNEPGKQAPWAGLKC